MPQRKGWGLLLGLCLPLLLYFSWSQLQAAKSRHNLERFESAGDVADIARVLRPYYLKNRKIAVAGDVDIAAPPANIGVKTWALRADGVVQVALDAKADGVPIQLFYVPVVRINNVIYDCLSIAPTSVVRKLCYGDTLNVGGSVEDAAKLEALIKTQLTANQQAMDQATAALASSGIAAGSATGSVVAVPPRAEDLEQCGFQCVKPQSCITPRPLACSKLINSDNSTYVAITATTVDYRGSDLPTLSAADQACEQSAGAGYKVLLASSITGRFKLQGGNEYWVHNPMQPEKNCWALN